MCRWFESGQGRLPLISGKVGGVPAPDTFSSIMPFDDHVCAALAALDTIVSLFSRGRVGTSGAGQIRIHRKFILVGMELDDSVLDSDLDKTSSESWRREI